ncbi:MAG: aldo/keto reductase [Verrucomicrobia bacterium]|nr:aldo/keto reductase [Verrucomicrobiota bacterium]
MKNPVAPSTRRRFLKTACQVPVALAAAPALVAPAARAADAPPAKTTDAASAAGPLPMRPLGRNGPKVTMLNMGGMMAAMSPQYLDIAWSMGIRYFDNADCYLRGKSERIVGEWLAKHPERRQELFLTSKDHPHQGPKQLLEMIDRRLEALGTTYLDAFYLHAIGVREYGEASLDWPKSDEFRKVAEELKSSGKVKMVGISCHDGRLNDYLTAAAEGGFLDIIMLQYTPFFEKGDAFDRALDACHAKGIALVAMKTMRNTKDVPKRLPELDKLGLTTHQGILQACWSDPRIASICNMIDNVDQMQSSTAAARSYTKPLEMAHIQLLKETVLAARPTLCPGCPSCSDFAAASAFALQDVSRFVSYYEQDGNTEAREFYHALPAAARNSAGVDLASLRDRCAFHVDYPEVVRRAGHYFA